MGRNLKRSKDGFTDIYKREMGLFRPRNVARRFSASEVSILFSLLLILEFPSYHNFTELLLLRNNRFG